MFVKWKAMKSIKWVNYLLITTLVASVTFAPIARGLSTVDERGSRKLFGGYRITPKFCRASKTLPPSDPRSKGPTICMFNHECAQRNGEVVGACMDGFLFGACCQIPGVIENSLLQQVHTPQITSNTAAALSYENYGTQLSSNELKDPLLSNYNSNPEETEYQNPTGTFYDSSGSELENDSNQGNNVPSSNAVSEEHKNNQFYVNHDSVIISSPSSLHYQSVSSTPSSIETSNPAGNYSSEVPTQISTQQYIVSNYEEETHISKPTQSTSTVHKTPNIIEIENEEFSHSDITHPAAESELIEDDLQFSTGYGPSTSYVPSPTQQTSSSSIQTGSSAQEQTFSHKKPEFKPKPTAQTPLLQTNDGNYVLIQTLSNDKSELKPPLEGITSGDIESIESIILMLNSSNHGPTYNIDNQSPDPNRVVYTPVSTNKAPISINSVASDKYGTGSFYITTMPSTSSSTNTRKPVKTAHPTFSSESNGYENLIASSSNSSTASFSQNHIASSAWPPTPIFSSTNRPSTIFFSSSSTTRKPKPPLIPAKPAQNNEIIITPTRRRPTQQPTKIRQPPLYSYVVIPTKPVPSFIIKKPIPAYTLSGTKTPKPISTSYVTGSTTSRPKPSTFPSFSDSTTSGISLNKIQAESYSTASNIPYTPSYGSSSIIPTKIVSLSPVPSPRPQKPEYVKIPATQRPPSPTVIITPKPAVNIPTASPWTKLPTATPPTTTINSKFPTNSHVISSVISTSERPDLPSSTQTYLNVPTVVSNDFDDPGYFANEIISTKPPFYNQLTTDTLFTLRPSDDRPAFPGYYGPTPSYGAFNVPTASEIDQIPEEETHTSPNDFVNFPPVRNPNLNMSATSSAVTYDLDMSTPAFVEDDILKDKMNLLVNKIVQSLQGNFNVLADIIEERNNSISQTNVDRTTLRPPGATTKRSAVTTRLPSQPTRTPTRRPVVTNRPPGPNRATTQRPLGPNRATTQRPSGTRKPTIATKKPLSTKKPATKPSSAVTKKPATTIATRRPTKPTRKVPTTTELQDEEENQDNSVEDNEIETEEDSEGSRRFQCGVRPHVKSGRIVGGKGATFGEYPWQVLVRESTWLGLFTKNKCGGVLITNKYVVTAAHCQPGFLASLVTVFGEFDISGDLETKRSVTKNVKRVIVHRQYDAATFENDLALLELESPIHYDSHIVPICMPPDTADFTGRMATVTGWGRLKYGGGVPSILQEVQVPIIENSVCQEMFHTAGHKKKILPSFLCAGYANGQKDSCEGDSGGPLVLQREDGHWELAGTVSHGIKCAAPYLPGVYMRTTYYKPWLKSITGIK